MFRDQRLRLNASAARRLGQRVRVDQPVAALRGGIHQRAVLSFEFRFEGVDAVGRLAPLTPADGEKGGVVASVV